MNKSAIVDVWQEIEAFYGGDVVATERGIERLFVLTDMILAISPADRSEAAIVCRLLLHPELGLPVTGAGYQFIRAIEGLLSFLEGPPAEVPRP